MVGRELTAMYPDKAAAPPDESVPPILRVRNLSVPGTPVADVSLDVRPGEVVGIAGLAGHGQNELLEGIAGIRKSRGELVVGTTKGPFASPRKALQGGIWLVPEDRKRHGLVLAYSVLRNLTLPTLPRFARLGFVQTGREREAGERMVDEVHIRPPDPALLAAGLSGGNQQKIVIGKALLAAPDLYVFADPTRGIDVGTKHEIYVLLRRLTAAGKGVLLMSTDLTETVGVCDRVLVMVRGHIVAELSSNDLTEEAVTRASFGEEVRTA
jgi:ABC-type sugar transport system ATPase subunit